MKTMRDLVVTHRPWILNKAKTITNDRFEAEELASETILQCLVKESHYDQEKDFKPWVSTIMRNLHISRLRRAAVLCFKDYNEFDTPSALSAESRLIFSSLLGNVRRLRRKSVCIDSVIFYAMGYEYKEIAKIFGLSLGTVSRRISDGKKILAAYLNVTKS